MKANASIRKPWLLFCIPTIVLTVVVLAAAQAPSFTTITGTIGPGAQYEIAMPTGPWNGELVVYAHGIVAPNLPVALPDIGPLRQLLTSQGFAVIDSSYSQNGYAVKDGMQRTHQLRGIFASKVGQPSRVYLVGHSLGALIALMLAERFPGQYDGALPACGLIGGGLPEIQYIGDARILFDYFFPGAIPGTAFNIPPGIDFSPTGPTFAAVQASLIGGFAPPFNTFQFGATARLPFNGPAELVAAGLNVAGFSVIFTNNILDLTNGHLPYDNTQTVYTGSANDAALNAGVARFASDPAGVNYIGHYYTPTGNLHIPVLTLHTTRDPVVPFFHEQMYAQTVQNAGTTQFLLQRSVDAFGHCNFTDAETASAFAALVQWVHTGVKPSN